MSGKSGAIVSGRAGQLKSGVVGQAVQDGATGDHAAAQQPVSGDGLVSGGRRRALPSSVGTAGVEPGRLAARRSPGPSGMSGVPVDPTSRDVLRMAPALAPIATTIGYGLGLFPRSLSRLGCLVALVLLVVVTSLPWSEPAFPALVLAVSGRILRSSFGVPQPRAAG
ncbi:hypothetical protein ACIG5E_38470 [Kitasatospora sp. NPDC053057]|uniref:hypothetical protein n=1 Tax=Kitasatospora sp. NPDC053057 TaxID=3364062 RepID=UPI0037CACBE6